MPLRAVSSLRLKNGARQDDSGYWVGKERAARYFRAAGQPGAAVPTWVLPALRERALFSAIIIFLRNGGRWA